MDAKQFSETLFNLLENLSFMDEEDRVALGLMEADVLADANIVSFEEAGILTYNDGLEITLADGTSFQMTIVRSA